MRSEHYSVFLGDRTKKLFQPMAVSEQIVLEKEDPMITECARIYLRIIGNEHMEVDWPIIVTVGKLKGRVFETLAEFRYGKEDL